MSIIEKFLAFLNAAQAVTVDEGPLLTDWEASPVTGELDNQVVCFTWTDGEHEYSCKLDEEGIAAGDFHPEGKFVCGDHEGEVTVIRFFKLEPITSVEA